MKGDRKLNGYKLVYKPDHFNAMKSKNWEGYVYEHRYVVECGLGRPLRDNEVVHHKNGDKEDNRACNLEVLTRGSHASFHSKKHEDSFCEMCGKKLPDKRSSMCRKCRSFSSRKVERPSKEKLELELSSGSFSEIGRRYGVSDNAVRKWAKSYGILVSGDVA